MKGSKTLSI